MTAWTVQCGTVVYYANTVTVEADTLEEALEKAIKTANAESGWERLDECGFTFIDAVAEGADVDPWRDFASVLPVPPHFAERGAPPLVTVITEGGLVHDVIIENGPVRVTIRDYDTEGADPDTLDMDTNGERFVRADWSTELPPLPNAGRGG